MKTFYLALTLCLPAPVFAACDVFLNVPEQMALGRMPETAMDVQDVEIELKSGEIVRAIVQGSRYVIYRGPGTFDANDVHKILRIFGRDGRQIYP